MDPDNPLPLSPAPPVPPPRPKPPWLKPQNLFEPPMDDPDVLALATRWQDGLHMRCVPAALLVLAVDCVVVVWLKVSGVVAQMLRPRPKSPPRFVD